MHVMPHAPLLPENVTDVVASPVGQCFRGTVTDVGIEDDYLPVMSVPTAQDCCMLRDRTDVSGSYSKMCGFGSVSSLTITKFLR